MQTSAARSLSLVAWFLLMGLNLLGGSLLVYAQPAPGAAKKTPAAAPKSATPAPSGKSAATKSATAAPKSSATASKSAPKSPPAERPAAVGEKSTATKKAAKPADPEEETPVADANEEEAKEKLAADRFLSVLEKNPRRGTALDKVYGFHVERGSLDQWLKQYRDRTAKADDDGIAWMLLGLIEAHRGQDAAAVKAFQNGEKHLAENPLASYYLGQSLVLVGQPDLAAAAFERAIERKPPQADLLEIFQALGRVYQRAQKGEKALEVWNRLEKLFPNDLRVQEQIAQTLVEEGQAALALPRFEALAAKTTKDLYRQSQFRIQVAEIKVRTGKSKEALADFEKLLEQLNPENWLYRDVRHKIDEVFLRTDDQAGLANYYEGWVAKHPEDVDAMARLARILATQGRAPEAQKWLEKGLKLAPSRKELRMAIIDQLVYDQKYAEAIQQYELLDQREPNNPDTIRDWGRLILKDTARKESERKQAAAALWKRLAAAKPQDPLVATQVADLFRHAEMSEEALALYKKAIELDPNSPQYREYLGEYYHQLKQPEEALKTWREIVAGKNRDAPNLARLAEVLMGFGYLTEGTAALADAVKLEGKDFDLRLRLAKAFNRGEKYDESLDQLTAAQALITNPEEAEAVLQLQLQNYQSADKLPVQIEGLTKQLASTGKDPKSAQNWYLLARHYEADRKLPEALKSITKSIDLDPQSIPALATMARVQEANNSFLDAAETYRKLAAVDRRFRTEYLTNVSKLEARLGRRNEALQAGRDVIASAPGNPDSYEFFAQLCFQLGENNEGLETLRRSVRVNPSDPKVVLALASALAEQFKTAEAIELYWRAFEKNTEIDGKLDVITKLTELYLQTNHLDRLLDRLERERREDAQQQRIMTLCLAQAHQAAGDFGTARAELERMLTPDTRDTPLLQQLAKLAESEGDYPSALKYQQQLNKLAPSKEHDIQLAQYMSLAGDVEQAGQLMLKITLDEKDPEKLLKSIDTLLQREQTDQVLQLTERLLREQPRNWEYLYREGAALFAKQPEKAIERFQQLIDLNLKDDELGLIAKGQQKLSAGQRPGASSPRTASARSMAIAANPILMRFSMRSQNSSMLRYITGLDSRYRYSSSNYWTPTDYGSARQGALAWLMSAAQKKGQLEAFVKERQTAWEMAKTNPRIAWDWYYIQTLSTGQTDVYAATKALAMLPNAPAEAQFLYLMSLASRGRVTNQPVRVVPGETPADTTPPLPDDELQLVLSLYKKTMEDPQFESVVQSYYGANLVTVVGAELTRAKREPEARQLYEEALARAKTVDQISQFMSRAAAEGNTEQVLKLWDSLDKLAADATNPNNQYASQVSAQSIQRLLAHRAEAKAYPDILNLVDRHLKGELARHRAEAASGKPKNKTYGNPYGQGQRAYYQVWLTKNSTDQTSFDYPTPNNHFEYGSILLLRNAYLLFQAADMTSDLMKHFETAANRADTPAADRLPWQLGLAYLHWWNDSQDVALKELQAISQSLPDDVTFKLELAELYSARNDFADSLQILDTITPLDQDVMQRRETLALRVAIQLGETDRAREAAARLFGLRLDAETQIQLASQMKQLGMHEQAEAVMARAGRQAGNRMGAMVSLMREFQAQGKTDTALQIAQTILRRTQTRGPVSRYSSSQDSNSSYRQEAVQFLVSSGKLKELIERTEAQLKNSPKSTQLHQTLAEFYTAAGEKEKARDITLKLAELNQNDPQARWNVARQLLAAGEIDKSIEHLKAALKQRPQLFANEYWEVQNAFRRAKKTTELVKVLDEIDLKQLGQYYVVSNIISELIREEGSKPAAMQLLKRAWEAYPQERVYLLSNIYDEESWKAPELYDYARQAFVPQGGVGPNDPWAGFDIRSYSGDGTVRGSLHNLLVAAKSQNRLAALEQEIKTALEKSPTWRGGQAMLAMIQAQRGEHEPALKAFQDILTNKDKGLTGTAAWLIAQELKTIPKTDEMAIQYYEYAFADPNTGMNNQFQYSPGSALVGLYEKIGQKEKARDMLVKAAARKPDTRYDQQYQAYQRIQSQYEIAQRLKTIGYPLDSIKIFNRVLLDKAGMDLARNYGGQEYQSQAQKGLQQALAAIDAKQLSSGIQALLQPAEGAPTDAQAPSVDLFLSLGTTPNKPERLTSLLGGVIERVGKDPALQKEILDTLQKQQAERPDDVSITILAGIVAASASQPDAFTKSVTQLDQWVTANPLETIPDAKRANLRQRELAARRLGIWLVARECLQKEPLREIGNRLSAHAIEAARRQPDNTYLLAMVREAGQLAWDAGDTATAETHWTEMLDLIITRPAATLSNTPRPPVPVATGTPPKTPPRTGVGVPPATLVQFAQILDIARLAEEKALHSLSLKAIRTAFKGGPPVESAPNSLPGQPVRIMRSSSSPNGPNAVDVAVANGMWDLHKLWTQKQAPADEVYAVLNEIILPAARPDELVLYPRPLQGGENAEQRSVGLLLVKQAITAKKTDDLRAKLQTLAGLPKSEFNARLLLAMLALEAKDVELAKEAFAELAKIADRYQHQSASELVCHIALPAIDNEALAESAHPLLLVAVKHLKSTNRNDANRVGPLLLRLARHEFKVGKQDVGKQLLDEYLKSQDELYQDYGGDYGQYMHKRTLQAVASEFAKAGQLDEAMQKLGEAADMPKFENYGNADDSASVASVLKQLKTKSPADQYKALKTWTLPAPGRQTIRMMTKFGPDDTVPEAFINGLFQLGLGAKSRSGGIESSARLLVQSAAAVNKLDELAAEVQPLVDKKIERARELLALIKMAQKKGEEAKPDLQIMLQEIQQNPPKSGERVDPPWAKYLVAHEAMFDADSVRPLGQAMASHLMTHMHITQNHHMLAHLRADHSRSLMLNNPATKHAGGTDPGLKWWRSGVDETSWAHASGNPSAWWVAHAGIVSHVVGPDAQFLYFLYPVTGNFEFSVDAYCGGWAEGNVGYGGLALIGARYGSQTEIAPHGYSETLRRPVGVRINDNFNRHTLRVENGTLRYYVANLLVYEDKDLGTNSPWLALHTGRAQRTAWRNLKITGQPVIPREIQLVVGDRLEGWNAGFYGESQPPRRTIGQPTGRENGETVSRSPDLNSYSWAAAEGVIHGQKLDPANPSTQPQSRLYYHRPLEDGDTLSYEFLYEPGATHVHPALDRLTFLLEPNGIRLHWMTDGAADPASELAAENAIDVPDDRRSPAALPLLPGQWNTVKVLVQRPSVKLELNGQLVYESQLDPQNTRQFGFFHYKNQTAAKVRNVVLTGNWPEQLSPEILTNLLAPDDTTVNQADKYCRHAIISEQFYLLEARDVLEKARTLPAAERYTYLKEWVLPNEDHPTYRLVGGFTLVDQPSRDKQELPTTGADDLPQMQRHTGGKLQAPALELIATAVETRQLKELATFIERLPNQRAEDRRCKLALLALINMSEARWNVAETQLISLLEAQKQLTADATAIDRWPDLLAAAEAARHPETRFESMRMFEEAVNQVNRRNPGNEFDHLTRALRDEARWLAEQEARNASQAKYAPSKQWIPASATSARQRGDGIPPGRWLAAPGELRHFSGRTEDSIYFQSPLTGDFEMECELSFVGWRELDVQYGGLYNSPLWTLNEVKHGRVGGGLPNAQLEKPLNPIRWVYDYKLVVKDGTITCFANGEQIHTRRLPAEFDPWLAIHSPSRNSGTVRNLRITGSPKIPAEVNLLAIDNLAEAWRGDYFNDNEMLWRKDSAEMTSDKLPDLAGRKQQSLVQYHRPLAEDGELDYEFYYNPGNAAVHPALDRLVMLVEPDGVKLHWITDVQFDRSGLGTGNVNVEKENRRGPEQLPLKAKDWNQARLKLTGSVVTLLINGVEVYQRELDPTNSRTFGLFHFSDETQARVRNIRYRGSWPTTLPSLAEQELAVSPASRATFAKGDLPHELVWNGKTATKAPFRIIGESAWVTSTPAGLKSVLPTGKTKPNMVGLGMVAPITGDFEVTGIFSGLKSTRPKDDPDQNGPGMELCLFQNGVSQQWLKLERKVMRDDFREVLLSTHGQIASGNRQLWQIPQFSFVSPGQRFKLVRKGTILYYLAAPRDSEDYRLIDERIVGSLPLEKVEFLVRAFTKEQSSEALLEELTIRTKEPIAVK